MEQNIITRKEIDLGNFRIVFKRFKNPKGYYALYSAWGYGLFSIKKNIVVRFFS